MKTKYLGAWIVGSLMLVACSASPTTPGSLIGFKVAIGPFISYAPLYIAKEEGYFRDEGLAVEFVNLPSSKDMIPSLAQGDVDAAGVTLTSSLLNLMARGAHVRFVADRGFADPEGCTYSAVLASNAMRGASPSEIAGSKVATDQASYQEFLMYTALAQGGLDVSDVSIENTVISSVPELLSSGQISFATAVEPWLTRVQQADQGVVWAPAERLLPNFEILTYVFGPSVLDNNREAGLRFIRAYLSAKAQYDQGKTDRNIQIVAKYTKLDPELIRDSCWVSLRADLNVNPTSVNQFQAWSVSRGYSDRAIGEAEFWDPSFVQEVTGQ